MADVLTVAGSWTLALIFAAAAHHKLAEPQRFAASLAAYQLVPEGLLGVTSRIATGLEVIIVGLLLIVAPAGAILAAIVLLAYGAAIAVNVARGRTHIDCGCGDEPTPVSWLAVVRNILLCGLAVAIAVQAAPLVQGFAAVLVAAASAGAGYGLYRCAEELMVNRGRHQRLWLGATA